MARARTGLRIAVALAFMSSVPPAFAEPALPERVVVVDGVTLTTRKEYYTLRAGTWRGAELEMKRKGPNGPLGSFAAYTDWKIGLNFPHAQEAREVSVERGGHGVHLRVASGCATGPVHVSLSVIYTLPSLEPSAPVEAGLEQKWSAFLRDLYLHEAGHRDLGTLAANEVRALLASASPEPTCQALDGKVRAGVNEIIGRYKSLEQEYDARSFSADALARAAEGLRPVGKSFDAVLGLRIPSLGEDGGGQRRALE